MLCALHSTWLKLSLLVTRQGRCKATAYGRKREGGFHQTTVPCNNMMTGSKG